MIEIQIYVKRASTSSDSPVMDVHHASFLAGARHAYLVQNPELDELVRLNHIGEVMMAFINGYDEIPEVVAGVETGKRVKGPQVRNYFSETRHDFVIGVSTAVPKKHIDNLAACLESSDYVVKVKSVWNDASEVAHLAVRPV